MERWMGSGAQLAWMIDPFAHTVSIYRPGVPVVVLNEPDTVVADTVISGFQLSTAKLWHI